MEKAKRRMKGGAGKSAVFVSGLIIGALAVGTAGFAFGAGITRTLNASYDGIKIYVDQKLIDPKDVNGNSVDPFIVDGTTYLPVRAVSGALGKEVGWDGATKSVYIGSQPASLTQLPGAGTTQPTTPPHLLPGTGDETEVVYGVVDGIVRDANGNIDLDNLNYGKVLRTYKLTQEEALNVVKKALADVESGKTKYVVREDKEGYYSVYIHAPERSQKYEAYSTKSKELIKYQGIPVEL